MEKSEDSESDSDRSISRKDLLKRLNRLERKLHKAKRRHRGRSRSKHVSRSKSRSRLRHERERSSRFQRKMSPTRPRLDRRSLTNRDYRRPRDSKSRSNSPDRISKGSASAVSIDDHYPRDVTSNNNSFMDLDTESIQAMENNVPGAAVQSQVLQISNDEELPDDILKILGDDPQKMKQVALEINNALSSRWGYILSNGLNQEEKDKILGRYFSPSNCEALTSPTLNPEIIGILSNANLKRDRSISEQQNQLCRGITALARGLQFIIDKKNIQKDAKEEIVQCLGDSGRILSDLSYNMSLVRRNLIMPSLNKSVKQTVEKLKPIRFLFGAELSERIREAKSLENASRHLKSQYDTFSSGGNQASNNTGKRKLTTAPSITSKHLNKYRPARHTRESRPTKGKFSKMNKYYRQKY